MQANGCVNLRFAAAISDMKWNDFFQRYPITKKQNRGLEGNGLFHQFEPELQLSIIIWEMEDEPDTYECNDKHIKNNTKERWKKCDDANEYG